MRAFWARLAPRMVGARVGDRIFAGFGAMAGVALAGLLSDQAVGGTQSYPWLVAPVGASAVLVFAVPASPLAQPWAVIGGNFLSALVGLTIGARVGDPLLAAGAAVGLAIMLMSLLRCLHPPGGAVALMTAIMANTSGAPLTFAFAPVALNSVFLVMLGWVYHRFSTHDYPHLPTPAPVNVHETSDPPPLARDFEAQDIDAALAQFHESYDIQRGDLELLLRAAEKRRLSRRFAPTTCAEIMSREVLCVEQHMAMAQAREIFGLRALWRAPVIDSEGVVVGMLTPIGLVTGAENVGAAMSPAICVAPETVALDLIANLADGHAHEAVVVDAARRPIGLVTQTDLLALTLRLLNAAPKDFTPAQSL
jgi:CBS domain-containing membrane protein